MKVHHPYQITHLKLDTQPLVADISTAQKGNYLVFWWKDIPLGHLFIYPEEKLSKSDFYNKVIGAILPAIQYYIYEQKAATPDWTVWLINQNMMAWNTWMENLLSSYLVTTIPAQVPVSVVICTRNRAQDLKTCLEMLKLLVCQPEEILVVDNAPTDNSTREVAAQFAGVTYIKEERPGLDIARNCGVVHAKSPVIAYVDDDVEVDSMWIYRVWEAFKDSQTAAITGLVLAAELQTEAQFLFERYWSFNRGYVDKAYGKDYFDQTLPYGPPIWEIGAGANMAFRKSVLEEVGLFDERLDVGAAGCNGDSEMWFRILYHGHTIRYTPRAVVYHKHRRNLEALNRQLFSYMRGHAAAALIQQHMCKSAGYKRYLFWELPKWYFKMFRRGFPKYDARYRLLRTEISGLGSGIMFYLKNRKVKV